MGFTVAIVGRPNVGKSTLFNRLTGRREAIVHDMPGVTRDRREGQGRLGDLAFTVIDTAGLEEADPETLSGRMRAQTELAIAKADVALFLIDARLGLTPMDRQFARELRKQKTPVVLLANKCEGRGGQGGLLEAHELGLGDPLPVSAEHGEGLSDLYDALRPFADATGGPATEAAEAETNTDVEAEEDPTKPVRLAIVGRPNVGKSTLANRLLGEERLLTGPEPGVTRDAITVDWVYKDRPFHLVDTAGLRRKARVVDPVERLSTRDTTSTIRMAEVVLLVVEADAVLDRQDLTIADLVLREGRALVIAVNKWDAAENRNEALQRLRDRIETSMDMARGILAVPVSAITGHGIDKLMAAVLETHRRWTTRIPTSPLNRWLAEVTERHPPPLGKHGRRLRLRYMTQIKARPPSFALFATRPDDLPDAYRRYLVNSLREVFDLPGVPIRLMLRKPDNPYEDD